MTALRVPGRKRFLVGFVHRAVRGISLSKHMPIPLGGVP
jgi:hypothetical protein